MRIARCLSAGKKSSSIPKMIGVKMMMLNKGKVIVASFKGIGDWGLGYRDQNKP
jgi:hypothetical protein